MPDPEHLKITTGLKQYQNGRTLPAELRPRMRSSFTLVSWVASKVETWIVRTEPRGMHISTGLQSCWAWRYPAQLVYGYHDIAIDMPPVSSATPLSVVKSASPSPDVLDTYTMEAIIVNETHATFYRDAAFLGKMTLPHSASRTACPAQRALSRAARPAQLPEKFGRKPPLRLLDAMLCPPARCHCCSDVVALPRPVTDCADASLIVGDSTGVKIGQLTYFPRALTSVELYEVMSDGMPLIDLVSGGSVGADTDVSDADFATERVAMEHAAAQQDRLRSSYDAGERTTRATLTLKKGNEMAIFTGIRDSAAFNAVANFNSTAAVAEAVPTITRTCFANEACDVAFALPPALNATNTTTYLRLVSGSSCDGTPAAAIILGCDAACIPANSANSSSSSSRTFPICLPDRRSEPATYVACAALACDAGSWHALGSVSMEQRDWAYVRGTNRPDRYDGTAAHVLNLVDPRDTGSSSSFSVSFNFKLPTDLFTIPIMKLKPGSPSASSTSEAVAWEDICWGVYLDGLWDRVRLFQHSHKWVDLITVGDAHKAGIDDWESLPQMQCDTGPIDTNEWMHLALVVDGSTIAIYLKVRRATELGTLQYDFSLCFSSCCPPC